MTRLLFMTATLAIVLNASDQALVPLVTQVESRYNGAKTLSVSFVETYVVQGHHRTPEAGVLTLRKMGKMRWDYSKPAGKLFVSDGKTVFLYTAKDNRVEKVKLKDTDDLRAPLAFLLGRVDLRRDFRDLASSPAEVGTRLTAKAKSGHLPYQSVEMLIGGNGSIRELKVLGADESVIEYRFTDERLNPPVADELFHFTIPPGAEIVDAVDVRTGEAH